MLSECCNPILETEVKDVYFLASEQGAIRARYVVDHGSICSLRGMMACVSGRRTDIVMYDFVAFLGVKECL